MAIDPLLQRLSELRWPTLALDHPEPAAGQLWRAAWGDAACLVVISGERDGRTVPVMAATADHVGDERAIVATAENGMSPSVWGGVAEFIKTFTLEHRITDLTGQSLDTLIAVAGGQQRGDWAPISSNLDDRVLVYADLVERLQTFSGAEWLRTASEDEPTLAELAEDAGMRASQIADHLKITPGAARRLLRRQREPSTEEVQILTDLLGSTPNATAQFDEDLVADLDLPEFRPQLRLIASNDHHGDEAATRRAFAGRMMTLAARPRQRGSLDWAALVRETLRED